MTDSATPATLSAGSLFGVYEILGLLGVGGMGEVYRARDSALQRDVALKVLPERFRLDPQRIARFTREAQVLASLNHPNIATLHGIASCGESQALVLELVEGETLAERILAGPLPVAQSIFIARQIATALAAAHEHGIVHRDLKPANVKLRPDGVVKLLDFGLAKVLDPGPGDHDLRHATITLAGGELHGAALGTPAYMSPEQTRGLNVDRRGDIWAFGCVLYEMLAAKPAFAGETLSDTVAAVLEREPDWDALPPRCPAFLRRLIRRCLAKDYRERLQHAGDARLDLRDALTGGGLAAGSPRRWVFFAAGAATAALLVAIAAGYLLPPSSSGTAAPRPTGESAMARELAPLSAVAVLPFGNGTGDPALDQPGADLVRSLNRVLSEAPNLAVVAQRSADSYGGRRGDVRDFASALGATHLLETRAIRSGEGIKVSVELIDGRLGYQVWSKDFRTTGNDFIRNRDAVLLVIAAVVASSGGSTVFEDREPTTVNVDAYVAWLRGVRSMSKLNDPGFVAALQHFKSATDLDPGFALAWMTTAAVHAQMMSIGVERPDSAARFREASERARESQPDSGFAHAAFASVAAAHGEWLAAEEHYQAAISKGTASYRSVMYVYLQVGRLREAEHDLRRLYAESPGDPAAALNLAIVCSIAGKSQESQVLRDQAVRTGIPDNIPIIFVLRANSAEQTGRYQEAADQMMMALDPAVRAAGGDEAVHLFYEALGNSAARPRAIAALKRLEPLLSHERFSTYWTRSLLIYWNARLGAMDQAYHLADDWVAQYRGSTLVGVPHLAPLWSPDLRQFRADPRFAQLATDLGFMDFWKKRGPPDGCRLDGEKLRCS